MAILQICLKQAISHIFLQHLSMATLPDPTIYELRRHRFEESHGTEKRFSFFKNLLPIIIEICRFGQ